MLLRRIVIACLACLSLYGVSACSPTSAAPIPTSVSKDTVSIQLSWTHEYWGAGFYLAETNGHFAEQNLDVKLVEGGFGPDGFIEPIDQVVDGTVDFGLGSMGSLLSARQAGKPVVAVATLFQRSPFALISLTDHNIVRPQDLVGKTVAVSDGGARMVYDALLASQEIDPASVNTIPRKSFGVDPLVNGEVDVLAGWIINEGVMVTEAGKEPQFILVSDYGFDTYDIVIFTTEDMVAKRPEVVERFLRGMFEGVQDVLDNPQKGAEATIAYNPKLTLEGQFARIQATLPLLNPAGSKPGMMDAGIWEFNAQLLLDNSVLNESVDVTKAYTLQFLDEIYNTQ